MNSKTITSKLGLFAVGGLTSLMFVAGPVHAATVSSLTNTSITLSGSASASVAVAAAASSTGTVNVSVLGANANVLSSVKVKVAADATITAAYSLTAKVGTLATVSATPTTNGCVKLIVSTTGAVTGNVKATITSGGISTVVQADVNITGPGTAATVVVCAV